jgi:hypothetical protein
MSRKLLAGAAAVALAASLCSAPTFAAVVTPPTQDMGNLDPPNAGDFDATVTGTGSFTVEASFELTNTAIGSVSATIAVQHASSYTPGTLELFDLTTHTVVQVETLAFTGSQYTASFTDPLAIGDYEVFVTGKNNVSKLGVGGSVFTSIVPEPSTWVMMAIGFSGLAYGAFRRSSKARSGLISI